MLFFFVKFGPFLCVTDGPTDATDGHTLLERCENTSKNVGKYWLGGGMGDWVNKGIFSASWEEITSIHLPTYSGQRSLVQHHSLTQSMAKKK